MGVRKCESESVQEGGGNENWSDNGEMSSVLFVLYNLNADKYPPLPSLSLLQAMVLD